mgnify:FL=1
MLGMDFSRLRALVESTYGLGLGSGRVFFVGSSTDRWFVEEQVNNKVDGTVRTTVDSALNACEAGRGDVVVVLPGSHTLTGSPSMPNSTRLLGVPGMREATTITSKSGSNGMSLSGNDCLVQGLTFKVNNGKHGITVTGLRNSVKDCSFLDVSGAPTSYLQVDGQSGSKGVGTRVSDCYFGLDAVTAIQLSADGNDQIEDVIIENCIISAATQGLMFPAHNATDIIVRGCLFNEATDPLHLTNGKTYNGSIIVDCSFAQATASKANITNNPGSFPASLLFVCNKTVAGISTAQPS